MVGSYCSHSQQEGATTSHIEREKEKKPGQVDDSDTTGLGRYIAYRLDEMLEGQLYSQCRLSYTSITKHHQLVQHHLSRHGD